MIQIDSEFRKAARRFKSPLRRDFDPDEWLTALKNSEKTGDDLLLAFAAVWIATESDSLRIQLPITEIETMGGRDSTILAVAALNREFHRLTERQGRATRRARRAGAIAFDHVVALPLKISETGQNMNVADYVDAATDSVGSWLWDAARSPIIGNKTDDLNRAGAWALRRYSLQSGLHALWQQALWEGWYLDKGAKLSWRPHDRQYKRLCDAWLVREESNFMNVGWIDIATWRHMSVERRRELSLDRSVTGVKRATGTGRFEVARVAYGPKAIPQYAIENAGLESSYLAPFLTVALPAQNLLNCSLLLKAWHVIADLAEVLSRDLPKPSFVSVGQVRRSALEVDRASLIEVLVLALGLDTATAEAVLEFFSWAPDAYKGLWGAPIVPIPGGATVCLARSVLGTSNPVRRVEIWLQKGGLDDSNPRMARGDFFETTLRQDIQAVIKRNELFNDVRCAPHSIKRTADFAEEIDLLIQLGSLLLVCEVKCLLFPAEPHERFNYFQKLGGAAKQAKLKAKAALDRPDVVARALSVDEGRAMQLRVIPLVVTNQGFGMSAEIDGCRIVDARFLKLFLGSGGYVTESAINFETRTTALANRTLYKSQAEAEFSFEKIMADPPTLRRFVNRLEWTSIAFPTSTGEPMTFESTVLKDVSDDDRRIADVLHGMTDPNKKI